MDLALSEKAARQWNLTKRFSRISLKTLRRLSIIIPVGSLVVVDILRHFVFPDLVDDWASYLVLWSGALLGVWAFSHLVFGATERMHKQILERNREISELYTAASNQAAQLTALREAGMALNAELSFEAVLQKVVDLSRELVGARYGVLAVLDNEKKIERLITSGLSPEARARITESPKGLGIMAALPDGTRAIRIADIGKHPLSVGFPPGHPRMKTLLGVPIISKGNLIGNLKLTNKRDGEEFTQEDEDKVVLLAGQAAVAVENARLHKQQQVLAILEERERIAQDLHDGIIQDIYAIGLNLEQCIEQSSNAEKLPERLGRAVEQLNGIIRDVRNYIFALQPTEPEDTGLVSGLDRLVREFRINSLIEGELAIHGRDVRSMAADQVSHLLQIAHEALTNVIKHARATSVTVELSQLPERLELSIVDNGTGFDPSTPSRSGLGLRNMAERTKIMGGSLAIDCEAGRGARVTVRIPQAT
ncbi:MAG: GAF domain-containing sensor histidine kinase [Dehalococcoidia bacterium]|nr:GAF domain-containing sensor histidine kinase [Dehalococcoidia bacterium]